MRELSLKITTEIDDRPVIDKGTLPTSLLSRSESTLSAFNPLIEDGIIPDSEL